MSSSFSVRCLFLWRNGATQDGAHLYEERITLWLATDIDHALAQAEDEATRYAAASDCEFLGFSQAYALPESVSVTNVEVFSLLRESKLISSEYIDAFFDTGAERGSGHA
jgi:hypothetical protein